MNITTVGKLQITEEGDAGKPMVVLLHGNGGTILDMTDPGSPSMGDRMYNYDTNAPFRPFRDLGWSWYPHVGPYSFELSPWKSVRSWRQVLWENGYRTASYSQVEPLGLLAQPVQELASIMQQLTARYPGTKFVLVAHSRGGLLARKMMKDNAGNLGVIGAISGLITLHSPHQGSSIANLMNTLNAVITELGNTQPLIAKALAAIKREVSTPSFQELAQGSPFLTNLRAGENPLPGVTYATFGGTSPRLTRVLMWNYDWWSSVAQWHWPPYRLGIYHGEAPWVSPVADGPLPASMLADIPELIHGVGDLLVTDVNAHLPFGAHRTNPLNHAEAFWDPSLHQQVLGVLNGIRLGGQVRYGQALRLSHPLTGRTLHSHALNYGHSGTSGQQQVTAFEGYDGNDLWRVKGPHGQANTYKAGQVVQHGEVIRLEHIQTGRNLHSHAGIPSPCTRQQEVTGFGSYGNGDTNDNWRVEIPGGGAVGVGRRMRLIHVNTNHALHSHAGWSHPQWTANQQEVTGFAGRDDHDLWAIFEIR